MHPEGTGTVWLFIQDSWFSVILFFSGLFTNKVNKYETLSKMARDCLPNRETDLYTPNSYTVPRLHFFRSVTNPTFIWIIVKASPRSFSGHNEDIAKPGHQGLFYLVWR